MGKMGMKTGLWVPVCLECGFHRVRQLPDGKLRCVRCKHVDTRQVFYSFPYRSLTAYIGYECSSCGTISERPIHYLQLDEFISIWGGSSILTKNCRKCYKAVRAPQISSPQQMATKQQSEPQ